MRPNEHGFRPGEPSRQGHVETELAEDIRVTPALKVRLLNRGEPGTAAALQLIVRGRFAERIEAHDAVGGEAVDGLRGLGEREGPETVELREAQWRSLDRGARGGESREGMVEIGLALPVDEGKWRLQGGMETIDPRLGGDLVPPGERDAWHARQLGVRCAGGGAEPRMP